jgi:hypothetical protein
MRPAFAKMMLDAPYRIEAEVIGMPNLSNRFAVCPLFRLPLSIWMGARPWLRDIYFIEEIELHRNGPLCKSTLGQ